MPYWQEKLRRNIERDKRVFSELEQAGWCVARVWECEVHLSLECCVDKVRQELQRLSIDRDVSQRLGTDQQ